MYWIKVRADGRVNCQGHKAIEMGPDQMSCSGLGFRHIHILHVGRLPVESVNLTLSSSPVNTLRVCLRACFTITASCPIDCSLTLAFTIIDSCWPG